MVWNISAQNLFIQQILTGESFLSAQLSISEASKSTFVLNHRILKEDSRKGNCSTHSAYKWHLQAYLSWWMLRGGGGGVSGEEEESWGKEHVTPALSLKKAGPTGQAAKRTAGLATSEPDE